MPEKLTLNDGTELTDSSALRSGTDLILYMQAGLDLRDVFDLLWNPGNTAVIVYTRNNGEEATFRGYDRLISVRDEGNGLITAVTRKEEEPDG